MNHRLWFKGHFEVDHCRFSTNFWNCIVFQSKCDFELEISVMVFIEIRWKRKFGFREKDLFDQNVSEEQKTNRRWTSEVQKKNIRKEQWLSLFEFTVTHNLYTGQERSSCGLYWNYAFKIELGLWFVGSFFTGQAMDGKLIAFAVVQNDFLTLLDIRTTWFSLNLSKVKVKLSKHKLCYITVLYTSDRQSVWIIYSITT